MSTERAGLLTGQGRHQRVLVMALAPLVQTSGTMAQRPIDDPSESGHRSPPGSVPHS